MRLILSEISETLLEAYGIVGVGPLLQEDICVKTEV